MPFVYIFKTGPTQFKIGRTKHIENRRKKLSTGNPNSIELFDYIETEHDNLVEKYLQKKFYAFICETGDSTEHYEIDSEILKQGFQEAREFLLKKYLPMLEQSQQFSKCEVTEELKQPFDEAKNLYKRLLDIRGKAEVLNFEKDYLENQLKVLIGETSGIEGMITWKIQTSMKFDASSFKKEHSDLYTKFSKESKSRSFKLLK